MQDNPSPSPPHTSRYEFWRLRFFTAEEVTTLTAVRTTADAEHYPLWKYPDGMFPRKFFVVWALLALEQNVLWNSPQPEESECIQF